MTDQEKTAGSEPAAENVSGDNITDNVVGTAQIQAGSSAFVTRPASSVTPVPVNWLIDGQLAQGKLALLAGEPGCGKSMMTCGLAALVSSGGIWPITNQKIASGNVIIISGEDGAADTIRPRLEAAGADLNKVHLFEFVKVDGSDIPFDLSQHLELLEVEMQRIGNVMLIIIDPISAYCGEIDSHKNAEVRRLLEPLAIMAENTGAAIACVTHFGKADERKPLNRILGSTAFAAVCRIAFGVTRDERDPLRRLMVPIKNNLGTDQSGVACRIEEVKLSNGIITSRVVWEKAIDSTTCFSAQKKTQQPRTVAKEFLYEFLEDGSKKKAEVLEEAVRRGISIETLERAAISIAVLKRKDKGPQGCWRWSLPTVEISTLPDASAEEVEQVEEVEEQPTSKSTT